MTIPSPCTDVCTIDATTGLCAGCLRTIDEIAAWGSLDDAARLAVCKRLAVRRAGLDGGGSRREGVAPLAPDHEGLPP